MFIILVQKGEKVVEKLKRGKLILIEGTDCSGKETQANLLMDYLKKENIPVIKMSFPDYESPTGKIVGGPYLGKDYICEGWFEEGANQVDPKVSSLYYAADFLYHLKQMNQILESGTWILLDRYFYSTFAHQGGKERNPENKTERENMYTWLEKLEFDLLKLPDPDIKILLHMPYQCSIELRKKREEKADQHEKSVDHLKHAEEAYLEIANLYHFETISCFDGEKIKSIEDISYEIQEYIQKVIHE